MNTTARIKKAGQEFEILVDMDLALKFKKGEISYIEAEGDRIFKDLKKGMVASSEDLRNAFGTTDPTEIAKKIVKDGEVLVTQEHRDEEREKKIKQVVDFLAKNATDPKTGNPHTPERIKMALEQAHVNIKNVPIDSQIKEIMEKIAPIIPITLKTKKIRITIPAIYTGKSYGIIAPYKENEDWMNDGSLQAVLVIPSGAIMDFYDKLNSVTHGSALTEELKD